MGRETFNRVAWWHVLLIAFLVIPAGIQLSRPPRAAAISADLPYRLEPAMTSSIGVQPRGLVAAGSLVVWQDSRDGRPDIFAYDLNDGREFRVAKTSGVRSQPAIAGSLVIWVAGEDPSQRVIEGVDLATDTPVTVTQTPGQVSDPAVADGVVVWREWRDGVWGLRGKKLVGGEEFQVPTAGTNAAHPSTSGMTIVWQSFDQGNWDIFRYDVGTGQTEALTRTPDDETDPVISSNLVLFRREPAKGGPPQLVLLDLKTRQEHVVVSDHMVMQGTLAQGIVVWEDWRTGLPDVYAYDVAHDQTFAVARSQQAYSPAVCPRAIAWISSADLVRGRIQAVSLVQRLPTDPQEPPAVPSPDNIYVPETRHFMSTGFKSYWQAHGGPQLFGYPLTEEFTEKDPQTGEEKTVQYFERVKMEFDPNAPEDQRIKLARLGAELSADRRFPRVDPVENSANRIYFPETGHTVAFGFKEFWEKNGGLAIFGFPLSEEITENGRTVQYFERARFEYNPDAKEGQSKVTLGLLGREALQRKGWLPTPPIDTSSLLE